jgi:hypothetical protein
MASKAGTKKKAGKKTGEYPKKKKTTRKKGAKKR